MDKDVIACLKTRLQVIEDAPSPHADVQREQRKKATELRRLMVADATQKEAMARCREIDKAMVAKQAELDRFDLVLARMAEKSKGAATLRAVTIQQRARSFLTQAFGGGALDMPAVSQDASDQQAEVLRLALAEGMAQRQTASAALVSLQAERAAESQRAILARRDQALAMVYRHETELARYADEMIAAEKLTGERFGMLPEWVVTIKEHPDHGAYESVRRELASVLPAQVAA